MGDGSLGASGTCEWKRGRLFLEIAPAAVLSFPGIWAAVRVSSNRAATKKMHRKKCIKFVSLAHHTNHCFVVTLYQN